MTRDFIKKQLPDIADDVLDAIMAEHGKGIEGHKNNAAQLTTERDALKTQLEASSAEIKSYKDLDIDGIKKAAADWETKYTTETQALKDQLTEQGYGFAVQQAIGDIKFTSESAKKAFVADLTAKKLPLQEGKLFGLDDFQKEYATADPGAFASEGTGNPPMFTRGTGGNTSSPPEGKPFGFNFSGVRQKPTE